MYIKSLEQANLKAWKINQSFPGAVGEWGANAKEYSVSFFVHYENTAVANFCEYSKSC